MRYVIESFTEREAVMSQVQPCARTTPQARSEINMSPASVTTLAYLYNITIATTRKWKGREDSQGSLHLPHRLNTTLTSAQELLVVELRRMLLLPLDNLLAITHKFIKVDVSRSDIYQWKYRWNVSGSR